MALNQDFKEFLQLLNDNEVRYLVVGGYAVALHGYPRYTKDIDIWIDSVEPNATKLVQAIDQFGFGSLGLKANDFLTPDTIIQMGIAPNRIDILTSIPGVDFATCFESRLIIPVEDVMLNLISLEDLRKNKKASGRLQDLADLERLT